MALTAVMWVWMIATRVTAMSRVNLSPQTAAHVTNLGDKLPSRVMRVADNYNHLFEAPTVFYAAVGTLVLLDAGGTATTAAAWAYVGLALSHSMVQATVNVVTIRFALFASSWVALIILIMIAGISTFAA
jgi:hypothetical protein